jgi:hypothetical protein
MPFVSSLHVDRLLSNISVKFRNTNFNAMNVFPEVPVTEFSDLYRVYDRNFKLPETRRSVGGVSREAAFYFSNATYVLEWHALKDYVADRAAQNYDIADLRADTTENLSDMILRRLEKSVMDLFVKANWSLNVSLAANNTFGDQTTGSNPIPIYDTGATTVIANSGQKPNFTLVPRATFTAMKNHISVLDRTKYTSKEMDQNILAALLGVDNMYIEDMSYDTTPEGVAASLTPFLTDVAFLGWKPSSPGPLQPSAGYVFRNSRPMVKRWRVEEREADAIEVNMEYQAKVVASLCGYLIINTEA